MSYRTFLYEDIIKPYKEDPSRRLNADAYFAWAQAFGGEQQLAAEAALNLGYIAEGDFIDYIQEMTECPLQLWEYVDWYKYSQREKNGYNDIVVGGTTFYIEE